MVHVLKISKMRQNSDISKSGPLPVGGSLSDTLTLLSLKIAYVSLGVHLSFLKKDNRDCSRPINMVQNRLIAG